MNTELHTNELLPQSFCDSLQDTSIQVLSNIAEVGLDSVLDDGILKNIPICSTVIGLYKIGTSIRDRIFIKKLAIFMDEIRKNTQDEEKTKKYTKKFQENEKFRNTQLEYILILLDRYIHHEKPRMLAKLYSSYLNDEIEWDDFVTYSEIIDRLLPMDTKVLCTELPQQLELARQCADCSARLVSLGLMSEITQQSSILGRTHLQSNGRRKEYRITSFGEKLASIIR